MAAQRAQCCDNQGAQRHLAQARDLYLQHKDRPGLRRSFRLSVLGLAWEPPFELWEREK